MLEVQRRSFTESRSRWECFLTCAIVVLLFASIDLIACPRRLLTGKTRADFWSGKYDLA